MTKVEEVCVGKNEKIRDEKNTRKSFIAGLLPGMRDLKDVGRIMSKDQLSLEFGSGSKKPSVSPSPSMRGPADYHDNSRYVAPSEDTPDTSRHSMDSSDTCTTQVTCLDTPHPARSTSSVSDKLVSSVSGTSGTNSPRLGIRRSESAKDGAGDTVRRNHGRRGGRKHSDPLSRGARHSLDGETVSKSGSSSNSSISETRQWDPTPRLRELARQDSDMDSDQADPPDWRNSLSADELAGLSPREIKRQDVINELFHTERSHVRNMKTLERVFRRPLLESGLMPTDVVDKLFPNLDDVIEIHNSYSRAMRYLNYKL